MITSGHFRELGHVKRIEGTWTGRVPVVETLTGESCVRDFAAAPSGLKFQSPIVRCQRKTPRLKPRQRSLLFSFLNFPSSLSFSSS